MKDFCPKCASMLSRDTLQLYCGNMWKPPGCFANLALQSAASRRLTSARNTTEHEYHQKDFNVDVAARKRAYHAANWIWVCSRCREREKVKKWFAVHNYVWIISQLSQAWISALQMNKTSSDKLDKVEADRCSQNPKTTSPLLKPFALKNFSTSTRAWHICCRCFATTPWPRLLQLQSNILTSYGRTAVTWF